MMESFTPSKNDEAMATATLEHEENAIHELDGDTLPNSYYQGKYFVGTFIAAGFASLSVSTPLLYGRSPIS